MIGNTVLFEHNIFRVLNYIWETVEILNLQYLIIWFGFIMIIATMIMIFSRISNPINHPISRIVTVPKCEVTEIQNEPNHCTDEYDKLKTRIMMDHTKNLRELHNASERCYIRKNALKCIQIISYCPYLVNVKNKTSGMTPFHKVCYHGHISLVSLMLAKGANPWLTTDAGETALCLAIRACIKNPNAPLTCIEYLRKYGCYLDHTNKWYRIYLESAILTNNQSLVRWMFNQASSLGTRCASFPLTRI